MTKTLRHWQTGILFALLLTAALFGNAQSSEAEEAIPQLSSTDSTHVSMVQKRSFDEHIVVRGTNLDKLLFDETYELWFGEREPATELSGNSTAITATFSMTPEYHQDTPVAYLRILKDGEVLQTLEQPIRVINPLFDSYKKGGTQKFLRKTKRKKVRKRTVGLNVHWALGAQGNDKLYERKLDNSNTKWVREFISFDSLLGDDRQAWLERYDLIFDEYDQRNIRVVVMLGYGDNRNGADRYVPPTKDQWEDYVRTVTQRYRNQVDAWEVWNEPDSSEYMHPNTPQALHKLLKWSYPIIKHYDPTSTVLNGPIANIQNTDFVREMYERSGKYFDELSIHLYYCDEYIQYGDNRKLMHDIEQLRSAIPEKKRGRAMWVTEFGCSLGVEGVNTELQRQYLKQTTKELLGTGYFRTILLFDLRDRPQLNDPYESHFGLMTYEGKNKPAWKWYRRIRKKQ